MATQEDQGSACCQEERLTHLLPLGDNLDSRHWATSAWATSEQTSAWASGMLLPAHYYEH